MRVMPSPARLALLLAAVLAAFPLAAPAQPMPADAVGDALPDAGDLALDPDDPPVRVGRVARLAGPPAELRLRGETEFQPARVNEPLLGGQAVTTPPGGRAELDFGATRLFLDGDTAMELADVPEAGLRAVLGRGAVLVRLAGAEATGETAEIVFADGTVVLPRDARVLIGTATEGRPARIAVFEGEAEITTPRERIRLRRGEAVVLADGGEARREAAGIGSALVAWAAGGAPLRAPPAAARGMTGAEDLGRYGAWQTSAEYGDIWYPQQVGSGWVPFSDGAWEWREPWGWTWMDAAPWAFATAHYGRWVRVGPRWGWAPAPVRYGFGRPFRPVWAPATVAFFGAPPRPGFGRPVGWVPLGPREPFYPWFRASPGFVQRANLRTVANVREVRNVWIQRAPRLDRDDRREAVPRGLAGFANRRAATVVPEDTLLRSRPVGSVGRRPRAEQLAQAEASVGLPLRPVAATAGVTRREAIRLGLDETGPQRRDADTERPPTRTGAAGTAGAPSRDRRARGDAEPPDRSALGSVSPPSAPGSASPRSAPGPASPDGPDRERRAGRPARDASDQTMRAGSLERAARPPRPDSGAASVAAGEQVSPMRRDRQGDAAPASRPRQSAPRDTPQGREATRDAARPRPDVANDTQREAQAQRAASQQQRAAEREQRRGDQMRPAAGSANRPDRGPSPERQERAAQRQQDRSTQRQQERGERR